MVRDDAGDEGSLVATGGLGVLGFGSYGPISPGSGAAATGEHTTHVRSGRWGRGAGRARLEALLERAVHSGRHVVVMQPAS